MLLTETQTPQRVRHTNAEKKKKKQTDHTEAKAERRKLLSGQVWSL